ncbi:MAG: metallophosphoesterase, partial [bacterium]
MIFITGDTHGDFSRFSSKKFPEGKKLTKQDYIIITGDFGGIWDVNDSNPSETYNLKWLGQKPWTTLFIDGNHENFDRLNQFPEKEMFNDIVGVVNDSIFHLKRGKVYIINKLKFFTFGGGYSLDKDRRTPYIHWWPQELPNYTEYKLGLDNLVKYNNKVDYIITHSCSNNIFHLMSKKHYMTHKENDEELQ